ncbi:hypothetical protein NPIL_551471, partial [Nephila pilipes]
MIPSAKSTDLLHHRLKTIPQIGAEKHLTSEGIMESAMLHFIMASKPSKSAAPKIYL